jgi:hypothetical protein
MSDQTNGTPNTDSTPKRTRKASTARIPHAKVIEAYANAHPKDPTAKGLRRVLRANKDADAAYKAHVKNTPWPAHRRAVLQRLFKDDAAFLRALTKVR